jgi:hypothetical protein
MNKKVSWYRITIALVLILSLSANAIFWVDDQYTDLQIRYMKANICDYQPMK